MSEPTTPPVPPVPQYGEYAPAGYVPPAQPPAPWPQAPYGTPQYGYPMYPAPGGRPRRIWDLVLTVVLLVVGFFGVVIGLIYAGIFSDPTLLDALFQQQGIGSGFDGTVGAAPAVIVASHIILYLAALGGSIPLLIAKRVAFWVPLAAGVIAAIIFWGTVMAVFASDPNFVSTVS